MDIVLSKLILIKHLRNIVSEYYNLNELFIEELLNHTLNLKQCHDNCSANDFRNCKIWRIKYCYKYYWVYQYK